MKLVPNEYELSNGNRRLQPDEIIRSIEDFEYFMGNFQQVTNKRRQVVPFKLNPFQRMLFEKLLPMVRKETRLDKRHHVVILKGRQVGGSVGTVALINYICAFVDGLTNMNILHVFPVGDTVARFHKQKVLPIISGVHPSLYPNISVERYSSSIVTHYQDVKGSKRNNYYELISASANSIRSATIHTIIEDEVSSYKHPEDLDNAIMPALPAYGFSLVIYLSTFEDNVSNYFKSKIETALDDPDDWTLIFCPWYMMYPEEPQGISMEDIHFTKKEDEEYCNDVIIPAMEKDNIPKDRWGDCIDWYFRTKRAVPNMHYEYPTTIDEVISASNDKRVFSDDTLDRHEKNVLNGTPMRMITDNITHKVEAQSTEEDSPFRIFVNPIYGHKYKVVVDPITSISEDSDLFAMCIFDDNKMEQVATFVGKGLPLEDYADYAVSMAKLYNNAQICPENNVGAAFIQSVYNLGYRNMFYTPLELRKRPQFRTAGIRTTVSNKNNLIDSLKLLLDTDKIIIHDRRIIDQLRSFIKKVKEHKDGSVTVKMMAKAKSHDDLVACLWLYVATLTQQQMRGVSKRKWTII